MVQKSRKSMVLKCHSCGGVMRRGIRPVVFQYKGDSITLDQPGWYCEACEESVHSGEDMGATEKAFMDFKARIDGVLSPAEVKRAREKLKLSQRRAGAILGGGPRAFQKYEAGKVAVSVPMSNLLRIISNHPDLLEEIDTAKRVKRLRSVRRLRKPARSRKVAQG